MSVAVAAGFCTCIFSGGRGTMRNSDRGVSAFPACLFSGRVTAFCSGAAVGAEVFSAGCGTMLPVVLATGGRISGPFTAGLSPNFVSPVCASDRDLFSVVPSIPAGSRCILVRRASSVLVSRGRPGRLANSGSLTENGTGLGGAGSFANTFLDSDCAGGTAACSPALDPRMLLREGATHGAFATRVSFKSCSGTLTAELATGSEFASTLLGTAVTAPGTFWFA